MFTRIAATAILFALLPTPLQAEPGCLTGIRAKLKGAAEAVVPARVKRMHEAVQSWLKRGGRVQSQEVQRILGEKLEQAQREGEQEFLKKWEDDITDRMTDKASARYPKVEELLALMSAKSPTFRSALTEFLLDKGSVRFKVAAHFMERVRAGEGSGLGGEVTYGKRFWNLWQTRIRLPARKTWTADDFALFMTETSNALFRSLHPEPGFYTTWISAFGDVRLNPKTWKVWEAFANKFLESHRAKYRSFMEGMTLEAYGKPRPEVIADFYKFGLWEGVYRRLAVFKILTSKAGAEFITSRTGLTTAELDLANGGAAYEALPRGFKNTLIVIKNPELYKDLLFAAEVEQLSLEVMYFVRPVVSGLFLYYTLIEPTYGAYATKKEQDQFVQDVKANPESYVPQFEKANDDRVKNYEDQINQYTIERQAIEKEIAENTALSPEEVAQRRRALDRINRRIENLGEMKADVQRSLTEYK